MKDPIKLRTIFMGTSDFAAVILEDLLDKKYDVVSVYTQKDKKIGRQQELHKSAVKMVAENSKLTVYEPASFNSETVRQLKDQKPDLIIVAAYGKILPKEILDIPGFGAINVHPSLLPKFRGPSPIQNALLDGEKETGATIILMDEKVDAGDILAQRKTAVGEQETYPELLSRLAELSSDLLLETLPLWIDRQIKPTPQDESQATLCQLIERADGQIIWADNAAAIYNRYRAFLTWPGIFTFWEKDGLNLRLKLLRISLDYQIADSANVALGQVFRSGERVAVQTADGAIVLEEVQLEGKNSLKMEEFLRGYPDFIGSTLK